MDALGGCPAGEHTIRVPRKTMKELVNLLSRLTSRSDGQIDTIQVHRKALDDLVSVNSLFTIAVFVGLSFASPGQHSLENRRECDAGPGVGKRLIFYEVVSFACFLLSSLLAKTLKVQLDIYKNNEFTNWWLKLLRGAMLSLTMAASFVGILFLTLSIVNFIEIRLGKLSCGSVYAYRAVASLWTIVIVALAIYLPSSVHALWVSMKHVENKKSNA